MESKRFLYTAQTRRGSVDYTYRPLIEIEVGGAKESRRFKALVDSGSDITVMDRSIAQLLEISPDGRSVGKLSGVGNWKDGFIAPVTLKLEQFPEKVLNFEVLFIENLAENFEIILGQQDFFLNFNVMFKRVEKSFYLEIAN